MAVTTIVEACIVSHGHCDLTHRKSSPSATHNAPPAVDGAFVRPVGRTGGYRVGAGGGVLGLPGYRLVFRAQPVIARGDVVWRDRRRSLDRISFSVQPIVGAN